MTLAIKDNNNLIACSQLRLGKGERLAFDYSSSVV
jgi:hypothetical protein